MNIVKTFLNNAAKETPEEREPYLADDATTTTDADTSNTTTTPGNKTLNPAKEESVTDKIKNTANSAAETVKEKANSAAETVKEKTDSAADKTKATANDAANKTNKSTTESSSVGTGNTSRGTTFTETYDKEVSAVAPVVHERVHKTVVDENQTIIDRDHHVDHYKKKIQPIIEKKDVGIVDESSTLTEEEKLINKKNPSATQAKLEAEDDKLKNTVVTDVTHESVQKDDIVNDKTHHHVHERVQPVIEKDVYQKEVVHNTKAVHETVQEADKVEETETLKPVKVSK